MTHTLTLQHIAPVTHDTNHLVFDKPDGFTFAPGQAVHWGLDVDGFRDAGNPFTITSLPDQPRLEFVIKTYPTDRYPDHGGMTERIAQMTPGDRVFIDEPSGDIVDKGPGIFIAGGAGITPFIPIIKERHRTHGLKGCSLIFSNNTEDDIILREAWEEMPDLQSFFVVTEQPDSPFPSRHVDAEFIGNATGFDHRFYVCGPPGMMKAIIKALKDNGVREDNIVVESEWLKG